MKMLLSLALLAAAVHAALALTEAVDPDGPADRVEHGYCAACAYCLTQR